MDDVEELLMADMLLLLLILVGNVCRALRTLWVILALFGVDVVVCCVEVLGSLLLAELLNLTRLLDV